MIPANGQLCVCVRARESSIEGASNVMLEVFPELTGWLNMREVALIRRMEMEIDSDDGEDKTRHIGDDDDGNSVTEASGQIEAQELPV